MDINIVIGYTYEFGIIKGAYRYNMQLCKNNLTTIKF